jgi:DNA repair protein RadA/Sms
LAEAARMDFTRALVPRGPWTVPDGIRVHEVADIGDALRYVDDAPGTSSG